MTRSNVEIVRTIYGAFETGDMAGFSAALAPDIVWSEVENYPYADGNPYVGAQAIMEGVFARTAQDFDGFAVSMTDLIDGKVVRFQQHIDTLGTARTMGREG